MTYAFQRVDLDSAVLGRRTFFNAWLPPDPRGQPILLYLHGWGSEPRQDTLVRAVETLAAAGHHTPVVLMPWGLGAEVASGWIDWFDGSLPMETHLLRELVPCARDRFGAEAADGAAMVDRVAGPHDRPVDRLRRSRGPGSGLPQVDLEFRDKLEQRGMAFVLEQYHGEHCSNHTLPSLSAKLLFLYNATSGGGSGGASSSLSRASRWWDSPRSVAACRRARPRSRPCPGP